MDWPGIVAIGVPMCGLMIMVGRVLQEQKNQGKQITKFCDHNESEHSKIWSDLDSKGRRIANLEGYRNGQRSVDNSR